jgi:hypothetical protein
MRLGLGCSRRCTIPAGLLQSNWRHRLARVVLSPFQGSLVNIALNAPAHSLEYCASVMKLS